MTVVMIPATWEQQLNQIVREFSPDVISIKFDEERDWYYDNPVVNFRVLLSDAIGQSEKFLPVARAVRSKIDQDLNTWQSGMIPMIYFRTESELRASNAPGWN